MQQGTGEGGEGESRYLSLLQQIEESGKDNTLEKQSAECHELRAELFPPTTNFEGKIIKKGKKLKKAALRDVVINISSIDASTLVQKGKKPKPLGSILSIKETGVQANNPKLGPYTAEILIRTTFRDEFISLFVKNSEVKFIVNKLLHGTLVKKKSNINLLFFRSKHDLIEKAAKKVCYVSKIISVPQLRFFS